MQPIGSEWCCVGLVACCWLTVISASAQQAAQPLDLACCYTALPDTTHFPLQRTQRGVRFVFRERGTGALAVPGRRVAMRYAGFLPDGHVFDASAASGGLLRFRVGRKEVIAGFEELLPLLPAGSRVWAWIPTTLAYGAKGVRDTDDDSRFLISPNTDLVFELLLVSVR